ncbi:MAG: efflux RND transporter permease subunit, partial [Methyloprofundus sp.]|nr:efflux RND transporter permease subunit [Methyloprofundus sp.]
MDPDPHLAFIIVNTETTEQVPEMVARVRQHILEHIPAARGRVKAMWLGASETGLMEIRIKGPDSKVLLTKAQHLLRQLHSIPGTLDIEQDWENKQWKVDVQIDQARARRAGVTSAEIADSLSAYLDGKEITDYREGDIIIPIIGRGLEEERMQVSHVRSINVYSNERKITVPLSQIADIVPKSEFSRIKRFDQQRTITVSAKHQILKAGELFDALLPALETLDLPPEYHWEIGGELEKSAEAQAYLFEWMPACFLLIIVLLVWQFNSFRRAAIIIITIPLTFIGAVIGLLVMNAPFGFMVILGLLSLAGIIINNGIVLLDRIAIECDAGKPPYEAVIAAAIARFR